ncbi:MAG: DUF1579 family protein [Chloroflexi bacterium]|nr:DUF1579 family protein [Chloroflexota bacterium]
MARNPKHEAAIPNPALEPLSALVGNWSTTGSHPAVPGTTFHGRTSFQWIEGGAFLIMHSQIDEPEIPSGIAIFGSDNVAGTCCMLYFDERGISRKYDVALSEHALTCSRDEPAFSRFTITIHDDDHMSSDGEMSRDRSPWEKDLSLTYVRAEQ